MLGRQEVDTGHCSIEGQWGKNVQTAVTPGNLKEERFQEGEKSRHEERAWRCRTA